jgi:hypothetical protein
MTIMFAFGGRSMTSADNQKQRFVQSIVKDPASGQEIRVLGG